MPVKEGIKPNLYQKNIEINVKALRVAFNDFSGRNLTDEEYNNLKTLCFNGEDKGDHVLWSQPKYVKPATFSVSRQGHITRIT
tara:strand:- start:848 stop:1096 length:249 start_codon:yes stop_codon:yes gene_type:complete